MIKYDYDALRLEYIQGGDDLSLRELARRHDISSWSTVSVRAKREEWSKQREDFRARTQHREIALMADRKAKAIVAIEEDFLKVLHASILKMGMDLQDRVIKDTDPEGRQTTRVIPAIQVAPADITRMIATMQTILGKPGAITEERHLGIDLSALGLEPDALREIARITAEPVGRPQGRASLPGARNAGPN